jgi:hypothetical protein
MLEMVSEAFPVSVTVTVCAALATPTGVEKVRLVGERVTAGLVGVGAGLLLEPPPPHPATIARPATTARARNNAAADCRRASVRREAVILTPNSSLLTPEF